MYSWPNSEILFLIQGFRLLGSLIDMVDIVVSFEFGRDIRILKVAIFKKVNYIETENI